ncbi:MAG: hypothetical protein ABFR47_02055 [Verrucomicrobiota bacterium]
MKSLIRHILIVSVSCCLLPASLVAGELVYNYADLAVEAFDINDRGYVGVEFNGSYKVHEKTFLMLGYSHAEASDVDGWLDSVTIGGGIMFQFQGNLDLVIDAGVIFREGGSGGHSSGNTGFALTERVRYLTVEDKVELSGGLVVESIMDNTELGVTLSVVYWATDKLGIKAGFRSVGYYESMCLGVRYALKH